MDRLDRRRLVRTAVENVPPPPVPDDPFSEFYGESSGGSHPGRSAIEDLKYRYAVRKLLQYYFDPHDDTVAVDGLFIRIEGFMRDLQSEWERQGTAEVSNSDDRQHPERQIDDAELLALFEEQIYALRSDLTQNEMREYTFWFPWHVRLENRPEELRALDLTFEPAYDTEWERVLDQLTLNWDSSALRETREEINTGRYDIWKTTLTAAHPEYALRMVKEALKLLSARLNHAAHYLDLNKITDRDPVGASRSKISGHWTAIQQPIAVFWEAIDDAELGERSDDHRGYEPLNEGGLPEVVLDYNDISDRYEQHMDEPFPCDKPLYEALSEYQRGLTADTYEESFYSFWRALESLTQIENVRSGAEIIDTAVAALDVASGGEYDPIITEVAPEVWDTRNNWHSNSGWDLIQRPHEQVAKILVDALIEYHGSQADDSK